MNTDFHPINCQTCHDPHSAENQHQLRKLTGIELNNGEELDGGGLGFICSNCHLSRRDAEAYIVEQLSNSSISSHFGPHGSTQTDMLFGKNAIEFGKPVGISPHAEVVENTCVGCHMQSYDPHGELSVVKDQFGDPAMTDLKATELTRNVYGHSFGNSFKDDDGVEWENVSACRDCHGEEMTSFDDVLANEDFDGDGSIEGVQSEVEGMLLKLAELLPPVGPKALSEVHPDPANHDYTEVEAKALYNFEFVYNDGSMGVHNAAYAIGLLRATITALGVGDIGAGSVSSVTDVPNDQGKQVRVAWNRFPGDGDTDPKIINYGVWRKVDGMMAKSAAANVVAVADYDAMYASVENAAGKLFAVAETEVWDYVKTVPAAELEAYATISGTIFDSTITGGQYWSHFRVSGHSTNNSVVMSVADSGYSVDNLAPTIPQSLAFDINTLTWTETEDNDFDYYAVYRSGASGFTPADENRIGVVTSSTFEDGSMSGDGSYYYVVSAFDHAGNESDFSNELEVLVTGIDDRSGVPTTYALDQNYPNPFNPSTVINYQLPSATNTKIVIYNVIGQEVRSLVNAYEPAGYQQTVWNGRDNFGNVVSAGIYFYKLTTGGFTAIKKMVFVK